MKTSILLLISLFSLIAQSYCQQDVCEVLMPELFGNYKGDCKKGLAHGEGTAEGTDSYTGHFKKGLPDGEGEYHYKSGEIFIGRWVAGKKNGNGRLIVRLASGKDSITEGVWQADKYIGKAKGPEYIISDQSGSTFPRIHNLGPGNKIELTIEHPLGNNVIRNVRIMYVGSATTKEYYGRRVYEDVTFPFELSISYSAPNKLGTGSIDSSIRVKILKPGYWSIILKN